jgi:acetyl esterase
MGEIGGRQNWRQDPEGVQRAIIEAATRVFARSGYASTRVEDIVAETETSKRMIYYYFGDKEGLYLKVLETAYAKVRAGEAALSLAHLAPLAALRRLIEFTFDHHRANPDFIRLVMIENVHRAEHLRASGLIERVNAGAIAHLADICARGQAQGVIRPELTALDLHWHISALSFFNVSNRPSFSLSFGNRLFDEDGQARLRDQAVRSVLLLAMTETAPFPEPARAVPMNPELEPFLTEWNRRWAALPAGATPADRRTHFEHMAAEMRMPTPGELDTDAVHWVEAGPGRVRVRIFRHREAGDAQPCLIYMHGGAWMQGSPETHWDITARIAARNRQTVISVDYALAPERPFPAGLDQCLAVVHWAHQQAETLGIDPNRIALGGDSAGANLAAALSLDLRGTDRAPVAQLLVYPACDFDLTRPSMSENADGPLIQTRGMSAVNAMYCPNPADLSNPRAAPLLAESHAELPPAFVAVAQYDPLRDSGLAYAQALERAGVPVTLDRGEGLIHGYLRAMPWCQASRFRLDQMAAWLARHS